MAFPDQIEKLVTKLTELTREVKVAWQGTANVNTYLAPVGEFVVTVGRGGSDVFGGYSFQILDREGRAIDGTFSVFPGSADPAYQDWNRLRSLHELARRSATHADRVVSDLLSSLEQIR